MTNLMEAAEEAFATLKAPMPETMRRELTLAQAADRLTVALEAARIAVDLTVKGHAALAADATPEEIERRQLAVQQLLNDTFDKLERRGRETVEAVNSLFSLVQVPAGLMPDASSIIR